MKTKWKMFIKRFFLAWAVIMAAFVVIFGILALGDWLLHKNPYFGLAFFGALIGFGLALRAALEELL